jgi:hypothetical protein
LGIDPGQRLHGTIEDGNIHAEQYCQQPNVTNNLNPPPKTEFRRCYKWLYANFMHPLVKNKDSVWTMTGQPKSTTNIL